MIGFSMFSQWIVLLLFAVSFASSSETFPAPLTKQNFDQKLASGLHLVEFFSPYCSHCKSFAPIWEKTWEDFHVEGERLGVGMLQVDCVESGDLCNQEKVLAYPSLRLYGPAGFIKNYPKGWKRKEEDLIRFLKQQALEISDPNFQSSSLSNLITTDKMIEILAQPISKPYLISLWPSSDLDDLTKVDISKFQTPLSDDVADFQRAWNVVSNQLGSSKMLVGHFNCLSNKKICDKIGVSLYTPSVMLVLPTLTSGKVIIYDQDIYDLTAKDIVEFAERVTENAKFKDTDITKIMNSQKVTVSLPSFADIPEGADIHFVYVYDQETVTPEDFEILPYLTEPLSKLPGTYIYKSNQTELLQVPLVQRQNRITELNKNIDDPDQKLVFNDQRGTIELLTTLPTLLCLKEYGLSHEVFHSFGPSDIRDQYRVIDWIREQSTPMLREFTRKTAKNILNKEEDRKIAILLADPNDEKLTRKAFNSFMSGLQEYLEVKGEYSYQKIISDRKLKLDEVKDLKRKNAKSEKIVKALSKEVHYENRGEVDLVHLDISKNSELLTEFGLNIDGRIPNAGDVIIIDKSSKFYYDTTSSGTRLTTVEGGREFAKTLSILSGFEPGSIKKNLRNSPYGPTLRFMDYIHRFGVVGYVVCVIVAGVLLKRAQKTRRMRSIRSTNGQSILDDPAKFD